MAPTRTTELPARLGPYVLGPVVGVGAAAFVVRARDERLQAEVAIKILRAPEPELGVRFLREAQLLRRVSHPAVVAVHDVGETPDGRPFLVMDLAQGSLADRLRTAAPPLPPEVLRAVVGTLRDGLGALHRVGIVHRDVKPANLLVLAEGEPGTEVADGTVLAGGERLVIGDLGFAKDQRSADLTTLLGGTPGFRAPEQLAYGRPVDARADVYASTAVLRLLVTGLSPAGLEAGDDALAAAPDDLRGVFARGLAADPEERFASMAEWAAAALAALGADGPAPVPAASPRPVAAAAFPYKGLAAFQPEDAALFFGRTRLVDELLPRLAARPTLVVGGPSGSGKSSLVRAGLIPRLAAGALPGSAEWRTCLFTPGPAPLAALARELGVPSPEALAADPRIPVGPPLLLAVDQFEELFTLCGDPGERAAFLRVLEALTGGAQPRARAVLAVRADFYAACADHPWLAAAVNANQVLVGPMSRAELRDAVEGPARRVGLHLQDGLADRVLAETGDEAGALPLLAHALAETWLRREGDVLTLAAYAAAGGVAGALARTADEAWGQVPADDRPAARRLLLRLVAPGEGAADSRRVLPWDALADRERSRLLVARFAEARLLTLDGEGVRFAHEAVLRTWPLLHGWLAEGRDELRTARRIEDAAAEWRRQGEHADLLYRGAPLDAAQGWRDRQDGDVPAAAAAFLDAGVAAREEAAAAEAGRAARAARLRRRTLAGLATLTAVAVVTSAVAVVGLQRSRRDADAARRANAVAAEQLAASLAASSLNLAARDPFLATVLAVEAATGPGPAPAAARDALVRARVALGGTRLVPYGDPVPVPDALALAVRPDGSLAAVGRRDGGLALVDLARRVTVAELAGPTGGVQSVAFTPDGRWLLAGAADGRVWRWDVGGDAGSDAAGQVVVELGSVVWAVAVSPDGGTVAASTQAGEVALVDTATWGPVGDRLRPGAGDLMTLAFADGGATLLAGTGRGEVLVWSVRDRTLRYAAVAAHTSRILELAVEAPPQDRAAVFATVSTDGTARLWDLATGARLADGPFDGPSPALPVGVREAAFSPDGTTLTLGGPDGELRAWSLADRREAAPAVPAHRDRVSGAASSADGTRVVTLGDDQAVQVWSRAARPEPVVRLAALPGPAATLALAPGAGALAVGLADGTVRLLDPATGGERRSLAGHGGGATALAFLAPDRLVTGDASGTLRLWDTATGARLAEAAGSHRGPVTALAAGGGAGDGGVLSGGEDGSVRRWGADLSPGPAGFDAGAPVTDLAAGEGGVFATTRTGQLVRQSGGDVTRQPVTGNTAWALALTGDATEPGVALARGDEMVTVRGAGPAGAVVWERGAHPGPGGALDVISAGGGTLATAAGDGRVRFFDAASGVPIGGPLPVGTAPLRALAAGPDGMVWALDRDGVVARVDVLVLRAACAAAGASLDDRQRARLLAGRPGACAT